MNNPALVLPGAMKAIQQLIQATRGTDMPPAVLELVHLRASQINGCSMCAYFGVDSMHKAGETDERMHAVAVWREAPCFTDAERAALALTEGATRLADRSADSVSDELWAEVSKHYSEEQLAALVLTIGLTNFFNRVNTTVKQPAVLP
jgi:AhpD family alkylhydroperoxidase